VVGNLFEDVSLVAGHDLSHLAVAADRESESLSLQVLGSRLSPTTSRGNSRKFKQVVDYRSHLDQSVEIVAVVSLRL
jgi:hypothetical protein